jgi:hypothetical protein
MFVLGQIKFQYPILYKYDIEIMKGDAENLLE